MQAFFFNFVKYKLLSFVSLKLEEEITKYIFQTV